jgi:signal transduction histidine kinase
MVNEKHLRVLIVAPRGRDAELLCDVLCKGDIGCERFDNVGRLCGNLQDGTGAILLTEEALGRTALERLAESLSRQPEWSNIPVVVLTSNVQRIHAASQQIFRGKRARGNLVIVERPVRPLSLLTRIDAALMTRRQQYELRDHLEERVRNEERLRQSQKMETVGILAGGVAHQFNNLLTGIIGNASLARDSLPLASPVRSRLDEVLAASEQAAHLTRELLAYAGRGPLVVKPVDLSDAVRQISNRLEASMPKGVDLRLELADHLPEIDADVEQIRDLIMGLVTNGAEAIPEGHTGTITVETGVRHIDEAHIHATFADGLSPGTYVTLRVCDTGAGMDESTLERIFDPFFSTKFLGRGLGLAAVMGIVRAHGGGLQVDSTPGKGSTFTLLFPASENQKSSNGR